KLGWAIVAIIIIGLGWWGLSKNDDSALTETGPIKIGSILPLTGDAASIGTIDKVAIEIAVDEVNQSGGINGRQLSVIYEDGQCAATPASSAANKLINADKVVAIIGGLCSTETATFAPGAMQSKVIVFSPASSAPNLSKTGKYFFRNYPSDAYQGKFAAEYAYNTLGARKIAVIYHISDWGTGIKEIFEARFKELGGQIVAENGEPQIARDYRTDLSKTKAANPDYIYSPTYPEGGTALLKQAKELGIKTKFLGADAWGDPQLYKDVNGLGLDLLYTTGKASSPESFKAKLLTKTGGDQVPIGAPQAYDAVYIIAQALKTAGTDPDKLADAIRATKYDGVSGHIEFDENGDLTAAEYTVNRIAGGTSTLVQ
ncbi:hypothetical protein A2764_01130, partial [Candidatus Kaiserbacteria bacterium RIFCSPHIGHO2_01_FULL_55_79]